MRIAIGSDHAGFDLKEEAKAFLLEENHEVLDVNGPNVGIPVTYKGVEIGSVIDILLSVEEVEVETCLSWLGELALPRSL